MPWALILPVAGTCLVAGLIVPHVLVREDADLKRTRRVERLLSWYPAQLLEREQAAASPPEPPTPSAQPEGEALARILALQAKQREQRVAEFEALKQLAKLDHPPNPRAHPAPRYNFFGVQVNGNADDRTPPPYRCRGCGDGCWEAKVVGGVITLCTPCAARARLHCMVCGGEATVDDVPLFFRDGRTRCAACAARLARGEEPTDLPPSSWSVVAVGR